MRKSIFQRRIPTLLGFLLVGFGIFISSWFLQTGVLFPTEAASGTTPQQIRLSNVSDTGFTVSYTTRDSVIGYVLYGTTPETASRAVDIRDTSEAPSQYGVHVISLPSLSSNTTYYYRIVSGDKEYMKDGAPFTFKTPATLNEGKPSSLTLSGTIQQPDGAVQSPVVVYVSVSGSQVVSTLSLKDGTFSFSYVGLRSEDLASYMALSNDLAITLLASDGTFSSKVLSSVGDSNPLPTFLLSQNYNFMTGESPLGEFNASSSADTSGFPSFTVTDDEEETDTAEIITPETNEGFSDQQPQFNGRALPNEEVSIVIHSDEEIKATVKANSNGSWSYRPTSPLSPGEHTLTIRTRDSFGILKEIKQSFIVYAEGSQFTDPSVSPVRSLTPTQSPTPTKKPSVTLSPTLTPSPTTIPTIAPSVSPEGLITPSPTQVVIAPSTPAQMPPDAGSPMLILSGLVGVVTLSVGLFVLFMSRGGAL